MAAFSTQKHRNTGNITTRKRRTYLIVLVWILLVIISLPLGTKKEDLPLGIIVSFAGIVSTTYIGLDNAGFALAGKKYLEKIERPVKRYLWLTIVWLLLLAEGLLLSYTSATMPLQELASFAGLVSASYVAGNKANTISKLSKEKEEEEK